MNIKLFILLFLAFSFCQNGLAQLDSIYKAKIDPWYTPNEDYTEYTVEIPKLEDAMIFFQTVDAENLSDSDGVKIGYYTDLFEYYRFPLGDERKEEKVKKLIDMMINHEALHLEYPKRFIDFFYKKFEYFDEEQRRRISLALVEPIRLNLEDYYHVINRYQITGLASEIKALLSENTVFNIKNSLVNRGSLYEYNEDFKRISVLANLDAVYKNTLLEIIKYYYDFINSPENGLSRHQENNSKIYLYGVMLKRSIKNLTNKKEIVGQTLYLLNEEYVLQPHGDQPEVSCAYNYYQYMITPLLSENRLFFDEWSKIGGDSSPHIRSIFEENRTPELMRAVLIKYGILEK